MRPWYICSFYSGRTVAAVRFNWVCVCVSVCVTPSTWVTGNLKCELSLFLRGVTISSVSKLWAVKLLCIKTRLAWTVKDSRSFQQSHCWEGTVGTLNDNFLCCVPFFCPVCIVRISTYCCLTVENALSYYSLLYYMLFTMFDRVILYFLKYKFPSKV